VRLIVSPACRTLAVRHDRVALGRDIAQWLIADHRRGTSWRTSPVRGGRVLSQLARSVGRTGAC